VLLMVLVAVLLLRVVVLAVLMMTLRLVEAW
jgi:hypothetical protein